MGNTTPYEVKEGAKEASPSPSKGSKESANKSSNAKESPTSPLRRSARKASPAGGSEISYDDSMPPDMGGYDDIGADMSMIEHDASAVDGSAVLDKSTRRVSFGGDVKEASTHSTAKKRGRPSRSSSSAKSTPERSTPQGGAFDTPSSAGSVDTSMSTSRSMISISTPGSTDFPRGTVLADESFRPNDDNDDDNLRDTDEEVEDEGATDKSGFTDTSYLDAVRRRREDEGQEDGEDTDADDDDDDGSGPRRSRRATKGQRFAFWKGERPVYESGKLVGLLRADPTPRKAKRRLVRNGAKAKKPKIQSENDENIPTEAALQNAPFNLPKKVKYLGAEAADEMMVWDENEGDSKLQKILCLKESLNPPTALPITAPRKGGNERVGFAAQYFNAQAVQGLLPGWIAGNMSRNLLAFAPLQAIYHA
jgi:hypothetical protein